MQLKTILHWVRRLPGFVYGRIPLVPFEEEGARPPLRSLRSLHGDLGAVCHFRCPLTTLEPRIPTWSGSRRRQRSSGGSGRAARPVRPFRSRLGPQRGKPRPVPPPVDERRPAVKVGRRVGPASRPGGLADAWDRSLATERRAAHRAVGQARGLPRWAAGSPAGQPPDARRWLRPRPARRRASRCVPDIPGRPRLRRSLPAALLDAPADAGCDSPDGSAAAH